VLFPFPRFNHRSAQLNLPIGGRNLFKQRRRHHQNRQQCQQLLHRRSRQLLFFRLYFISLTFSLPCRLLLLLLRLVFSFLSSVLPF